MTFCAIIAGVGPISKGQLKEKPVLLIMTVSFYLNRFLTENCIKLKSKSFSAAKLLMDPETYGPVGV